MNLRPWSCGVWLATVLAFASSACAVDFEAFEFNDPNGTELFQAANSVNAANRWFTTNAGVDVLPSEVRNGSFNVYKDTNAFVSSYLQMDNVSSGKVYLITRMSSWALRDFVAAEPEEIRFGFLDEDTGDAGNTITAQFEFARTSSGGFELNASALGDNATNVAKTVPLSLDQTTPFTTVLEVDQDADIYKMFYQDGSNPAQFLGSGNISRFRDANSVRFVMNNNWGSDFDTTNEEHFAIDRFAIADTNPFTDLLTLNVDRSSGSMTLINTSGSALPGLVEISITSAAGALDAAGWKPVTGNYDFSGDRTVDSNDNWMIDLSSTNELRESVTGGDGGMLAVDQPVVLSQGDGPWIKSPYEDVQIELLFANGSSRSADVNFTGNGGVKFPIGDLDFDGQLAAADWLIFASFAESDMAGLSLAQSYQRGDLDGDGNNNVFDFGIFQDAFNTLNGPGSFDEMLASLPEPGTLTMTWLGVLGLLTLKRRGTATINAQATS